MKTARRLDESLFMLASLQSRGAGGRAPEAGIASGCNAIRRRDCERGQSEMWPNKA